MRLYADDSHAHWQIQQLADLQLMRRCLDPRLAQLPASTATLEEPKRTAYSKEVESSERQNKWPKENSKGQNQVRQGKGRQNSRQQWSRNQTALEARICAEQYAADGACLLASRRRVESSSDRKGLHPDSGGGTSRHPADYVLQDPEWKEAQKKGEVGTSLRQHLSVEMIRAWDALQMSQEVPENGVAKHGLVETLVWPLLKWNAEEGSSGPGRTGESLPPTGGGGAGRCGDPATQHRPPRSSLPGFVQGSQHPVRTWLEQADCTHETQPLFKVHEKFPARPWKESSGQDAGPSS